MSARVVIIGAGVVGLSTAYYCARRGFDVTVVERSAARRDGTSYGNAGMIVPSHFIPLAAPGMIALGLKWMWNPASPFYVKPRLDADLIAWGLKFWRAATPAHVRKASPLLAELSLASRAAFEELAALPGMDFQLVKNGLAMLCRTQHSLDEEAEIAKAARALGLAADVLDAKQTATLNPGVETDAVGSVYFPEDCHLTPQRLIDGLQSQLEQTGVKFLWETEALNFAAEGRGRLRALAVSGGHEIEAEEFVLCGGVWSPELVGRLGLRIPMQAGKGYSLTMPTPPKRLRTPSILTEARVAVTPMGDALRVGGTMEIAGLNDAINPVRVRGIIGSFCRYFPEFLPSDFEGIQPWSGLRPCSPDGLPYVGRTARFANLSIAAGHAMMGVSLGPITGQLVAQILAGERPSHVLTMLSPDRY